MEHSLNLQEQNLNLTSTKMKTDLFDGLKLLCPFFESAYEYCCEQNCKENAVICVNEECKCKTAHRNCDYFSKVKNFNQKINNKILNYSTNEYLEIEQNTNKIVDRVSLMLDQINSSLKTFGLNENEETVKDSVISHFNKINLIDQKKKLTGENLFKFRAEQKQADKKWFQFSINKYRDIVKQTKKAIQPLFQQIQTTLIYMHSLHSQEKSLKNYLNNSAILKQIPGVFVSDLQKFTEIINQNLQVSSIKKIFSFTKEKRNFPVQTPQQGQSLFSKNRKQSELLVPKFYLERQMKEQEFQSKKFYEALKGKSNLIFLIMNSNCKYGVFTPCLVDQSKQWKQDCGKSSFLFKVDTMYSEKLLQPQKGLKFLKQNVQIGNIKNVSTQKKNGFNLNLENGEFLSEIMFQGNPSPNSNQNSGLFNNNNNQVSHLISSHVLILEVYQLQGVKNIQKKLEVKNQGVNNIFGQPAQVRRFRRITVDN